MAVAVAATEVVVHQPFISHDTNNCNFMIHLKHASVQYVAIQAP